MYLPRIIGLLVVLIEFFCPLFLLFGFGTHIVELAIAGNFTGVLFSPQIHNGFFMNRKVTANQAEGWSTSSNYLV